MKNMVMLAVAVALIGCSKKEPPKVADSTASLAAEITSDLLNILKKDFKDPSSVQFRNVKDYHGGVSKVCGELNAKNSYGGYEGFKRFTIVMISKEPLMIDIDDGKGSFEIVWKDSPCYTGA